MALLFRCLRALPALFFAVGVPAALAAQTPALAQIEPVRIGGPIKPPTKIQDVAPIYPLIAQSAQVTGIVIIEATIGPDGRVTDAKVLRSVALLDQAAINAVRQWRYAPTTLNGVPVPVRMTVTASFPPVPGYSQTPPTPQTAQEPQDPNAPVRVGGNVKPPTKTKDVQAIYPEIAKAANVSGMVILEIRLDTEGKVAELKILRSIALLDQAAIDAVKQWEYAPTFLNGVPVQVLMTVTVNFQQ